MKNLLLLFALIYALTKSRSFAGAQDDIVYGIGGKNAPFLPGRQLPQTSNFRSLPGRAGGLPYQLLFSLVENPAGLAVAGREASRFDYFDIDRKTHLFPELPLKISRRAARVSVEPSNPYWPISTLTVIWSSACFLLSTIR